MKYGNELCFDDGIRARWASGNEAYCISARYHVNGRRVALNRTVAVPKIPAPTSRVAGTLVAKDNHQWATARSGILVKLSIYLGMEPYRQPKQQANA